VYLLILIFNNLNKHIGVAPIEMLTRLIFTCILLPSKSVRELYRWLCKGADRCAAFKCC